MFLLLPPPSANLFLLRLGFYFLADTVFLPPLSLSPTIFLTNSLLWGTADAEIKMPLGWESKVVKGSLSYVPEEEEARI